MPINTNINAYHNHANRTEAKHVASVECGCVIHLFREGYRSSAQLEVTGDAY